MATGFMSVRGCRWVKRYFSALLLAGVMTSPSVGAQEVGLAGIMGSKALLMINGGEPQAVAVGQTVEGVKLVAIRDQQAIVELGGKSRPLRVGQHAIGSGGGDGSDKIVLTADSQGHFFTTGTINGTSVRFIVDTGATSISLGASDARRLGLDFNKGQKAISNTANGQTTVSVVKLDTVRVGGVTLHNVDGVIHQTEMPYALLGMSFLNRMEMSRDGATMTLKKRF